MMQILHHPTSNLQQSNSFITSSNLMNSFSSAEPSHHAAYHPLRNSGSSSGIGSEQRSIRSRKSSAVEFGLLDSEITRPSLKRITTEQEKVIQKVDEIGKDGKARTSFDGLRSSSSDKTPEREVIIHELCKTDTIASVSLQYGLSPQALRLANRLWPSDSIHLRRNLLVPLDQCNLPSSSSIERVSTEGDGLTTNLIVWEKESRIPRRATNSNYEGSSSDLLSVAGEISSRSSLDSFRTSLDRPRSNGKGKAPALLIDGEELDPVLEYLPSTNNPYSFSAPPSPPTSNTDYFGNYSPFGSKSANNLSSQHSSEPSDYGPSSSSDSLNLSPSFAPTNPPILGQFSRKTLTVERMPSSSMSFFPLPKPAFSSNASSNRSSFDEGLRNSVIDEAILNSMFSNGKGSSQVSINPSRRNSADKLKLSRKLSLTPLNSVSSNSEDRVAIRKISWFGAGGKFDPFNFGEEELGSTENWERSISLL